MICISFFLNFFIDMCQKKLIWYPERPDFFCIFSLTIGKLFRKIVPWVVILFFTRKDNFLSLLWGIWIKQHLPLISPLTSFNKFSLKNSTVVLGSCTTEKSEVSSADSLATDVNPSCRSIYTKKILGRVWNPGEHQPLCDTNLRIVHWE